MVLLIFVALVTPYEVAFLDVRTLSPLWCVNRTIDGIFFIDLCINFNLIYFSDSGHGYVSDRKKVAARWGCTHERGAWRSRQTEKMKKEKTTHHLEMNI